MLWYESQRMCTCKVLMLRGSLKSFQKVVRLISDDKCEKEIPSQACSQYCFITQFTRFVFTSIEDIRQLYLTWVFVTNDLDSGHTKKRRRRRNIMKQSSLFSVCSYTHLETKMKPKCLRNLVFYNISTGGGTHLFPRVFQIVSYVLCSVRVCF